MQCGKPLVLLLITCLLPGCGEPIDSARTKNAGSRPNFLVIVADDMGYTDLGAFGGSDIDTPNLDRLASGGMRFGNFHGHLSCSPSRAMLMSGTGNHEAGLGTQTDIASFRGQRGYERYLVDRVATLPEVLGAAGYRTYISGKWGLGGIGGPEIIDPVERGFAKSFVLLHNGGGHYQPLFHDSRYSHNGEPLAENQPDVYSTTLFVDRLMSFFSEDEANDAPFFALFTPTAPHWPLHFPPQMQDTYAGRYDEGYDVLRERRAKGAASAGVLPAGVDPAGYVAEAAPWHSLSEADQALNSRLMEIYAAMTTHLDREIGRLLQHLQELGELDNTLILFINDNGAQGGAIFGGPRSYSRGRTFDNDIGNIGAGSSWANLGLGWAEAITAPYRDSKASVYEGGLRVAAFASWVGLAVPGAVSSHYLTNMDVMPTLLELAGVAHPAPRFAGREVQPMRGRSFAGLLRGDDAPVHPDDEAIALSSAGRHFMQRGDWKILQELNSDWELYNLVTDPYERNNLASDRPELLRELLAEFRQQALKSNNT